MTFDTVATIRSQLAYAPPAGPPPPAELLGWWTPEGFFVCASCTSRLIARGCGVPADSLPVWSGHPRGVCIGCEPDSPAGPVG